MFLGKNKDLSNPKWDAISLTGVITAREQENALRDIFVLCNWAQPSQAPRQPDW